MDYAANNLTRPKRRYRRRNLLPNGRKDGLCSRCGVLHERSSRYCFACHAAYMRDWRKSHPLNSDQRFRDNARSQASVAKRRGKIAQRSCEHCGSADSEMHHDDYRKPLAIRWLCRDCHLALHRNCDLLVARGTRVESQLIQQVIQH